MISILVIANISVMQFLAPSDVKIEDPFWSPKYRVWREKTVGDVFDKLEKDKWFENFDHVAAGELGTKTHAGPHFANGLCYEAIRGTSDYLAMWPDESLDRRLDGFIARIASAQAADPDGYLNTHNQLHHPQFRWGENGGCLLSQHELYNAGMLIEAGVHHARATGKTMLLAVATRYANLLCDTIGPAPKHNRVPTHSGPEEAVLKLACLYREMPDLAARAGVEARPDDYVKLVEYWMNMRGHHCGQPAWEGGDLGAIIHEIAVRADELYDANDPQKRPSWGDYAMDRVPLDEYESIEGHAVRATLLATGIATLAEVSGDNRWLAISTRFWESMVGRKMYVTGGVGALSDMERFGSDYYLPSAAYLETCAAIGSAFFSSRMAELTADGKYVDEVERVIYNAMLTAVSESGTEYTYENPLENEDHKRWAWHNCPCCPPMFLKLTGAMPGYIYSASGNAVYVNLFIGSKAEVSVGERKIPIAMDADRFQSQGRVDITVDGDFAFALKLRIPGWAVGKENPFDLYTSSAPGDVMLALNGVEHPLKIVNGYATIDREWKKGDRVTLTLPVGDRVIRPNPAIADLVGKVAHARGPVVYALENGSGIPYYSIANGKTAGEKCSFAVWNKENEE